MATSAKQKQQDTESVETRTETDTGTNVAVKTSGAQLPAYLSGIMEDHAGKGVSTKAEDQTIPMIYVLQDNSPQVKERDPGYVKGAKPGDFWFKGLDIVVPGATGFSAIPCYFDRDTVEWIPRKRGGGYVGRHKAKPEEIPGSFQKEDPENPKRERWYNEDQNELVDTRYHYVMVDQVPYVITFSSTGHTTSRNWMLLMNSVRVGKEIAPSYAKSYKLTTNEKSNVSGSWFGVKVEAEDWVQDADDFAAAAAFYENVASGKVAAEAPLERDGGAAGGSGAPAPARNDGDGDAPF